MSQLINTDQAMQTLGCELAQRLDFPFCLELIGDVGAGKTTFVKGLASGLKSRDQVTSPSFTINNRYDLSDGRVLAHYDFYRLGEAGVLMQELAEDLSDTQTAVVMEWAQPVQEILPNERMVVTIDYTLDGRTVDIKERHATTS